MKKRAVEGLQLQLDWRTLAETIADMYQLDIKIYEVKAAGKIVGGNVERYADGRAVIMVKSQQAEDVLRFVTVKELCHLLIDEEDDWSTDALLTIRQMKQEFDLLKKNGGGVDNPSRTQMSEMLAEIAAIALSYPCEFHKNDFAKIDSDEVSIAKIALEHGTPGWAVEFAYNHQELFAEYKEED